MPSVNKVILIGNLTRDPQVRQLPTNSMVAEFGLAMSRKYKTADGEDREEVAFVDCSAFGRQAEVIAKYCKKGKSLYVEGRLRYDTWDDKNGHGKRSKLTVTVENFQFLGGKDEHASPFGEQAQIPFDAPPPAARNESREPVGASAGHGNGPKKERGNWDGAKLPDRPARAKAKAPFGDKPEFKEADIPF
ncbi:MAG TPA: single-stranded DNA-binding protein [Tepidisphaeraceae bacterium]|nr:single-stranded DNA-binding protein [Tepidisphaeraceae bacterium]